MSLAREGLCSVLVPVPERYAVHKLVVSQLRANHNVKAAKDLHQAKVLAAALGDLWPGAIEAAVGALSKKMARGGGDGVWLADVRSLITESFGGRPAVGKGVFARHPFGVEGLGWGTWVASGSKTAPATVCGGGLRSFPWQVRGEIASVHATWRYEEKRGIAPMLVAWDGKPKRRAKAKPTNDWDGNKHVPTDLVFVDVPGGSFEMGLGAEERARLEALVPPKLAEIFAEVADQCPPRQVTVQPFRCAASPLSHERSKKLGGSTDTKWWYANNEPRVVMRLARRFGLRLLSEEEWEYVARDGGRRAWGADLEVLLRRAARGGKAPPRFRSCFGVEGLIAPAYVNTGTKLPTVARSVVNASYGAPKEILDDIRDIRSNRDVWRAALFAVDEEPS